MTNNTLVLQPQNMMSPSQYDQSFRGNLGGYFGQLHPNKPFIFYHKPLCQTWFYLENGRIDIQFGKKKKMLVAGRQTWVDDTFWEDLQDFVLCRHLKSIVDNVNSRLHKQLRQTEIDPDRDRFLAVGRKFAWSACYHEGLYFPEWSISDLQRSIGHSHYYPVERSGAVMAIKLGQACIKDVKMPTSVGNGQYQVRNSGGVTLRYPYSLRYLVHRYLMANETDYQQFVDDCQRLNYSGLIPEWIK